VTAVLISAETQKTYISSETIYVRAQGVISPDANNTLYQSFIVVTLSDMPI